MSAAEQQPAAKRPDIGLRQARKLCQMPHARRLSFIAEGLPIILDSAQGFWTAAQELRERHREAAVMEGFAAEEAAKILILMDVVRCPPGLIASRLNRLMKWFYDHLARGLYAQATTWKPMHLAQLREYVDQERRAHYVDGYAGEYIIPNWTLYGRESTLYADVESLQDGELVWSAPRQPTGGLVPFTSKPHVLRVAEAMDQLGLFTAPGLHALSDIWGSLEYQDQEDHHQGRKLTWQLLQRLAAESLIRPTAGEQHQSALYEDWQIPMYNLDFTEIAVSREDLEAAQEREYWAMVGDP